VACSDGHDEPEIGKRHNWSPGYQRESSLKSGRFCIWWVLVLALSLRAALPILVYLHTRETDGFYAPDTESYLKPAQELINHNRFYSDGTPEIIRTPGYPLLLTLGLALNRLWVVMT